MKKTLTIILAALTLCSLAAVAQDGEYKDPKYSPKRGDWSIGVTFNPASLAYKRGLQPKKHEFAGDFIEGMANSSKQMFVLSQDPLASFRFRYILSVPCLSRHQRKPY